MKSGREAWFGGAEFADPRDPQSAEDAISLFSDPDYCNRYLAFRRWPEGRVTCPVCGASNLTWLARRRMWECKRGHPKSQFNVRSGTFLEHSHIGLGQWLTVLWLIAERNARISSYEMARRVGITQKSAWLMIRRIRRAMDVAGILPAELIGKSKRIEAS
jgi:transposase-like protein